MHGCDRRLSRRTLLAGAVAGLAGATSITGCRMPTSTSATSVARWHRAPDPLLAFLAATIGLAERYDGVITAVPAQAERLAPIRDAHRAHIAALARHLGVVGNLPPAAASPTPDSSAVAGLRAAEQAAEQAAVAACLAAPRWQAGLLGSIAAARACHLVVLT